MNELVSIIMPSYNVENFILNTIESVLAQTYNNWELLIIDDCSTDDTINIVKSISDPRIILLQNQVNVGAAISRNYGLREARGKWVAFLDSDDLWHPQKLERQIRFMKENNYAFTFTDFRICLNGKWMPYINIGPNIVDKRKIYNYCYFSIITVIYDREKIGLIQTADLKKRNDYALWFHTIEKSKAYRFPECLSFYMKHDGSVSSGRKTMLVKYQYFMFRKELHKNILSAIVLTINNIIHGSIKKIVYKIKISKYTGFGKDFHQNESI